MRRAGLVPEDTSSKGLYRHDAEGSDDMPVRLSPSFPPSCPPSLRTLPSRFLSPNALQAHIKSALIGASVSVPIMDGKLALGTWQGIWFLEFRDGKQRRKCVATVQGVGF